MKILYAIQGTGNGHVSRARDVVPALRNHGQVDIAISGIQVDVDLGLETRYRMKGMGFMFGKKGGVDLLQTFRKCVSRRFLEEMRQFPVEKYDLVINDFEPVTAWAARLKGISCISLSHQYAVLHPEAPRPQKTDWIGKMIMTHYAPVSHGFGYHFKPYHHSFFTPVIRKEIRAIEPDTKNHITVYLPAYDDKRIIKVLSEISSEHWHVFSKHCASPEQVGNISIFPIENQAFLTSLAASKGVLCGAGFETPAEAMFLGKKLLVIPMKNQYEQQCNAAALENMGIHSLKSLKTKRIPEIRNWLENAQVLHVPFPDETAVNIEKVINWYQTIEKPEPTKTFWGY